MKSPTRQQPNKVLAARVSSRIDLEPWPFPDFEGDPWWAQGSSPRPFKWQLTVTCTTQQHSDPTTRESFQYNGNDIYVGDWISDLDRGRALKIISIVEKNSASATFVVEDVDRYNTFQQQNGQGLFPVPSDIVIFETNDSNMPVLNPLPQNLTDVTFSQEVMGRFMNNNPLYRARVQQVNHGLLDNDTIWVDPADGLFKKIANDAQLKKMVGTVDRAGPGPDIFYFVPTTKIVEGIEPALPGTAGSLIFVDPMTGTFTTNATVGTKVAYIQLTNSTPDITRSRGDSVAVGDVLGINEARVPMTGTTLTNVITDVNATTALHGVTATLKIGYIETRTVPAQLVYGLCACLGNTAAAWINGVAVLFNDVTNGTVEFGTIAANAVDMANSINARNIPNIQAIGNGSSSLTIRNTAGGSIDIVNISTDSNGMPFAGNSSCTGLPVATAGGATAFIEFTNASGSGIIFKNITGAPVDTLALTSVRNGALPIGLVVEQYVTTGNTSTGGVTVYQTLDQLPPFAVVGSQAFVIDNENNGNDVGEWAMYLWDGFNWTQTSNEDSTATDARTMQGTVTPASALTTELGTLSTGRKAMLVMIEVTEAFNGSPTLTVGDTINPSQLMTDNLMDLSSVGSYSTTSDFVYDTGHDNTIIATFASGGSTTGIANITVTYV